MIATFYETATGRVTRLITGTPEMIDAQNLPGEAFIEGDWLVGYYVDIASGAPLPRTPFTLTVSHGAISGLPAGTIVSVEALGLRETVDDGVAEFAADYPQTIAVNVEHFMHLTQTVEVACGPD